MNLKKVLFDFEIMIKRIDDVTLIQMRDKFKDMIEKITKEIDRRTENDINNILK